MWTYQGEVINKAPEEYQGFVYVVTDLRNNKKYIGKKFFWKPKTLPVTKTRKRRVKTRVESDWQKYYGSSIEVQQLVEQNGEEAFSREIIYLCKTKGDCSYYEAKHQFETDALLSDDFYNSFIGLKVHSKHLTKTETCV